MSSIINGRLQTPEGITASLLFDLPASMVSSSKIENRIQPYGQSSYTSSGQVIKLVIPKTDRAFINTQTMYLTGQIEFTIGTAVAGTDFMYILGSYYSLFSRQVVSSNGKQLETIEKPGELCALILNQTLNPSEKVGMANNMGFYNDKSVVAEGDQTFNMCQAINTGVASSILPMNNGKSVAFAIPIIGLLNSVKFLPLFNGDFTLELTVNAVSNYLASNTAAGVTAIGATTTFSINNLELVVDQINLTPESFSTVLAAYPEKLYIKSQSYDYASSASFTVTPSSVDLPINIKRSSLKQILFYFNQANLIDKTFGGVNCNLSDVVFASNAVQYPQRPIRCNINPSEAFNQVQKAYGSLYSNSHGGSMGKQEFCRRTTASNYYFPSILNTTPADLYTGSNKFYLAIDTEIINYNSDSLYSGISMGTNSNFRLNIGDTATASTATLMSWFCYDAIIEFDLINQINSVIA